MFTLVCQDCGKEFQWASKLKKYCPSCIETRVKIQTREFKERQKNLKPKKVPFNYSVTEIVKIIEKYNRENKTRYTYGQFSELIRMGKV